MDESTHVLEGFEEMESLLMQIADSCFSLLGLVSLANTWSLLADQ